MTRYISGLRKEYTRERLLKETADPDPVQQFARWFQAALDEQVHEPNAMVLATATATGRPSARTVLLKSFDTRGFCFFTNYDSRKGRELRENPFASLVFWWGPLERQVRIEGGIEMLSAQESDEYFDSRPLGSRLAAWASAQSTIIEDRHVLEERLRTLQAQYTDGAPPRPPFWGGYRVDPSVFEFWQGGPDRLHDRLRYTRQDDGAWKIGRLAP